MGDLALRRRLATRPLATAVLLVLASCADASAVGDAPDVGAASRASWVAARSHVTTHLRPVERVALAPDTAAVARFLVDRRDVFAFAAGDLALEARSADELGMTHVRFRQLAQGVPVLGGEIAVHLDAAGDVSSIASTRRAIADLDVMPSVAAPPGAALVVYARRGAPCLAWQADVDRATVTIDAHTGDLLERDDHLRPVAGEGIGVKGEVRALDVSEGASASYVLVDADRHVTTYTASNTSATPGTLVGSSTATAWDQGGAAPGAAVDAHFHAGLYADFLASLGRRGVDGEGGALIATVHYGKGLDNAYWMGTGVVLGDGESAFFPLAGALDVVAHEFTHGVTEHTSHLAYSDEPGALNEAISDFYGAMTERMFRPNDVDNWRIAEGFVRNAAAARDMAHPEAFGQPSHYTDYVHDAGDYGGVHSNSGIANNAFYLMSVGGENRVSHQRIVRGVGPDLAIRVLHRANERYLLESSTFADCAVAMDDAARDLGVGGADRDVIACAWQAVGVLEGRCANESLDPHAGSFALVDEGTVAAARPQVIDSAPLDDRPAPAAGGCGVAGRAGDGALVALAVALLVSRRRGSRRACSARRSRPSSPR